MVLVPWPSISNEQQQDKLQEEKSKTRVEVGYKTPTRGSPKSFSSRCVWSRGYSGGAMWQGFGRFPGLDGTYGARRSGLAVEAAAAVQGVRLCWDVLRGPWGDEESHDGKS